MLFAYLKLFLNSHTTFDDDNLMIEEYNSVRSEHPSNSRRASVGVYYYKSVSVWEYMVYYILLS